MKYIELDPDKWQAARNAIASNDFASLRTLSETDPEVVGGCTFIGSCLHFAAEAGRLEIVQLLIERGVNVEACAEVGGRPLNCAAAEGHMEVVKLLIAKGAILHTEEPHRNPLFSAVSGGHANIVKLLINAGIDPHVVYRSQTGKLKNALSYAQDRGEQDIVDLLVKSGCRLPVEGIDKPVREPEDFQKPIGSTADASLHEAIVAHMAKQFGSVETLALQEIVPVDDEVQVAIHVIRPNRGHGCLTLFTTGMSDRPMQVPPGQESLQYAELFMHLPASWKIGPSESLKEEWYWPVQWLRQITYFAHQSDSWLRGPQVIITPMEPPAPLGPNTKQTCLLLLADFNIDSLTLKNGKTVRFFAVVPLYTEERDFEKQHGIVALLQRLQERGHTATVDVNRENVA